MLDVYLGMPGYWRHLRPIWEALPHAERGTVWTRFDRGAQTLGCYEAKRGVPRGEGNPVLTAGGADARQVGSQRLHFHMNHGVGQTYYGDPHHPIDSHGYIGGSDLDRVDVFLCVNDREADDWQRAYPRADVKVIGSPALDHYHGQAHHRPAERPTVLVTFHWDCRMIAEAGTAWPDWRADIERYVASDPPVHIVGHEHPRWNDRLLSWWRQLGVDTTSDPDVGLMVADAVIADNTSLLYEAAAVGLPVGVLNASNWRRNIHHGLRFWDAIPGLTFDPGLGDFDEVVRLTLGDGPHAETLRRQAVQRVWPDGLLDGQAARRAADIILGHTTSLLQSSDG